MSPKPVLPKGDSPLVSNFMEGELPVSALSDLSVLFSDSHDFGEKVYHALAVGCRRFGLPEGALYRLEAHTLEVTASVSPENRLTPGDRIALADSPLASRVVVRREVVLQTSKSPFLGAPVVTAGGLYGIIAFSTSNTEVFTGALSAADTEFIRLLALWLGSDMDRTAAEVEREAAISALNENQSILALARDEALSAARVKAEFLANISHEIRTPMNGLLGMADLLLDTRLSQEQQEFVRTMRASAGALLRILNDVLDFSKLESGKMVLEREPLSPGGLAEEVATLFAAGSAVKGVEMICYITPDVPHQITGDDTRLRQALSNLVGNAIKFTHQGHILVTVDYPDSLLRFTVSDTGIGIPEDRREAVFDSFIQADGGTTRKYGGTGLGLTISRRLVEMMGSDIHLESQVGVGSTFSFAIDLPLPHTHERIGTKITPSFIGKRVLVASDQEIIRDTLAHLLEAWRCDLTCTDSFQGIRTASEGSLAYDAILLDIPASAGSMVLPTLSPNAPLLLLAPALTRSGASLPSNVPLIYKPWRQNALRAALETLFARSSATTERSNTLALPSLAIWTPDTLLRTCGQDKEIAREVLGTFLETAQQHIACFTAVPPATGEARRVAAHYLRSGAATIGASALADACGATELESDPAAGDTVYRAWAVLFPVLQRYKEG